MEKDQKKKETMNKRIKIKYEWDRKTRQRENLL